MGAVKIFDLLAGGLLLVSMINGLMKGAAHEVVRVTAFVIAAAASLYLLRYSGPVFHDMVDPAWMATTAAILVVFVVIYLALRLLGAGLAQSMQGGSGLGALDRVVGMGFGLVRALVLLGMFSLLLHAVTSTESTPAWVKGARLYPLTEASGRVLKVFAPRPKPWAAGSDRELRQRRDRGDIDPNEGYSVRERRQPDD